MRHRKPFTLAAIRLAALIVLLSAGGGLALAQSPTAPAKTTVAAKPAVAANPTPAANPSSAANPTSAAKPTVAANAPTATPAAEEDTSDIRDIRPPIHIAYSWLWAVYVAAGLGLAGLAFAAWRWHRWYRQSRRKLLYELTLDELEAVRALMVSGQGYQFSIAVSEIVRAYIEKRFEARAARRTTEEFLHDLLTQSHSMLTALTVHQPLLAEFLGHCDLAKFARWQLSVAQMENMHRSACTFVIETGKPAEAGKPTAPTVSHSAAVEPQLNSLQPRST